jgi:hypothetical protein
MTIPDPLYKGEALKAGYKVVFEINARTRNWYKWDISEEDSWDDFAYALPRYDHDGSGS